MRESISARHRLDVTLRFLATGETYRSLMYSTRIHETTISKIIPETCSAIYKRLKGEYLKTPTTCETCEQDIKNCTAALPQIVRQATQIYIGETCEQDIKNCTAALPQIVRQAGNNYKTSARIVREEYKNYFNSERGAVPWQDNAVQRGNW
ncbi:hypothetical protein QE152_g30850 [Popillia japonica]